jgi:hypothetical protein
LINVKVRVVEARVEEGPSARPAVNVNLDLRQRVTSVGQHLQLGRERITDEVFPRAAL